MSNEITKNISIAVVCNDNTSLSQIAEGFLKDLGEDHYSVYSAGTTLNDSIDQSAIDVMNEMNIDISMQHPKNVGSIPKKVDVLITMGSPSTIGEDITYQYREDWDIKGPEDDTLDSFRVLRDTIKEQCTTLINRLETNQILVAEEPLQENKVAVSQTELNEKIDKTIDESGGPVEMSETEYDDLIDSINSKANYSLSIILGLVFGIVGAAIWAIISKVTGYNLGIVAILIGFLISQGFVIAGRSTKVVMGIVAAIIAVISILIGNIILAFLFISEYVDMTFFEVVQNFDYGNYLFELLQDIHTPFDIVFYPIAMMTAFRRSYINKDKLNVVIVPNSSKQHII